jgi:hypothetical protein
MTGHHDPASFVKAVPIFTKTLGDHPYSKWVEGTAQAFKDHLAAPPDALPLVPAVTFTTKLLIDVFLYTQYAHQPNPQRQREFEACLAELNGKRAVLTWLFLTEIWNLALEIGNAGNVIAWWFKHYCQHHRDWPDVLKSLRDHHAGLGAGEKEEDRRERLFQDEAEQLATDLWKQAGEPAGGPSQFLASARNKLGQVMKQ